MSHRLRASGRARFHARAPRSTAEPSSDGSVPASSMSADDGATGKIVIALGVAMLLASSDRTIFAAAALSIKSELAMSMKDVALAQSSFLWGYGVTQLAAGAASDKYGGVKVLLGGLAMWSLAVAATPVSAMTSAPVMAVVDCAGATVVREALSLSQTAGQVHGVFGALGPKGRRWGSTSWRG